MQPVLICRDKQLSLKTPIIMGVLNITPDSFSDGGQFNEIEHAVVRALQMQSQGAGIIDVGGASTRPGAAVVSPEEECARVVPVIEALAKTLDTPISIDTYHPEVMRAAVNAGATIINDVKALQMPGALEAARDCDVPVCLMHMQGEPQTMQANPSYKDVYADVFEFLKSRVDACVHAGIAHSHLIIDPGFGFGKTVQHNLLLLQKLSQFSQLGLPILVGLSRKAMIQKLIGREIGQRMPASLALAVMAVQNGAHMIRCHDVQETVDAIEMVKAVQSAGVEACDV